MCPTYVFVDKQMQQLVHFYAFKLIFYLLLYIQQNKRHWTACPMGVQSKISSFEHGFLQTKKIDSNQMETTEGQPVQTVPTFTQIDLIDIFARRPKEKSRL